jgi:hypothetical protein
VVNSSQSFFLLFCFLVVGDLADETDDVDAATAGAHLRGFRRYKGHEGTVN